MNMSFLILLQELFLSYFAFHGNIISQQIQFFANEKR